MKEIVKWCWDNLEIIKEILKLLLILGGYLYAFLSHKKSKGRLNDLEAEHETREELIETIKNLQKALEESKKEGN